METKQYMTDSEEATIGLGVKFSELLKPGDTVALFGELGSGKTQFIKGICNGFKVEELVTSPTFTIINRYFGLRGNLEIPIYHVDLYRIKHEDELVEIGFTDCLMSADAVKLVEWAEKGGGYLDRADYTVRIEPDKDDENKRIFTIETR